MKESFSSIPQSVFPLKNDDVLFSLLSKYHQSIHDLIIYDPNCKDSINIATILAGQHDGFIVSPLQAQELQKPPYQLPLIADLRLYKWTNSLEVYCWAQQHLLSNASPHFIVGLNPDTSLGIRSFLVATRTFIYWLNPLSILPNPHVDWLSERSLMQQILSTFAGRGTHLGWFIHEGPGVSITSKAAIPVIAMDFYSNLEVWTSLQPTMPLAQHHFEKEMRQKIEPKVYVSFTMSEGDNLQYIQAYILHLWQDSAQGSFPLGCTFSPLLLQAAPQMAAYYIRTAT